MMRKLMIRGMIMCMVMAAPGFAQAAGFFGGVYAMTNDGDNNQVVVYDRAGDGILTMAGVFDTGGKGRTLEPGDALGAQGPLILSPDHRWLFAVNAGSNSITVFRVVGGGLHRVQVISSGGDLPVSLSIFWNLLYVLNADGDGNITGFRQGPNGRLVPLPSSTRSLDAGGSDPLSFIETPAQVGFSPLGNKLVVSVKGKHPVHQIHVFKMNLFGLPSAQPTTTTSNTTLSFGFAFNAFNRLIVAEPFGNSLGPDGQGNDVAPPVPFKGAVSSYKINPDGTLETISTSVLNAQTATCWMALTADQRFAYTTNNVSNTISSYKVGFDGSLTLIDPIAADSGQGPVDLAISPDSKFLYNVNTLENTVSAYEIDRLDGSLTFLGDIGGLPDSGSAVGMAVY